NPPPSSHSSPLGLVLASLARFDRVARRRKACLLAPFVHCALRSLRLALLNYYLPHSLVDERHVCSLVRPGQRRTSLAQHGGARLPTLAARHQAYTGARARSADRLPPRVRRVQRSSRQRPNVS